MDRLVCGDVGFGKTEVALRAAFIAAMNGVQVAVVVPTTLLARQHYKTFVERFRGLPIRINQASRLWTSKELALTKEELASGKTDIVVGTHALLGSGIKFANLGLLIIDEEQHFGVKHKERLKELKSDIHVLTLSATPIPRTMQLAMTGVRELSLITTPPVDRMAVRTFISPFDGLVIRETLMREHYRGGQSFYVCPRLADLSEIHEFLTENVPELKVAVAHGQMAAGELEDVMNAFYDGQYDVLLSTTIVESGLDVPTANTMIVHRADMFGLAQLYQLRGRVGRSKVRAFALFTLPVNKVLTQTAERRLKVLQSLDTLGAGFQLASHDLDIRGAGNLLGEEQSGHIKEVGFELYQQMLEEAVAEVKGIDEIADTGWSPQISVGASVMIRKTMCRTCICASAFIAASANSPNRPRSMPSVRNSSTASARSRWKSNICSRSSISRVFAGLPMSRSSMRGRRASSSSSATRNSRTRQRLSAISPSRAPWRRSVRTRASS